MSLREGYLTKQGGKVKTWKRRWFSLDSDYVLHYYTNVVHNHQPLIPSFLCRWYVVIISCRPPPSKQQGAELKGEFSLKTAGEIREIAHKKKFPYLFEVETPNRTYRMAADNEESVPLPRLHPPHLHLRRSPPLFLFLADGEVVGCTETRTRRHGT